jgi:hypothetical protein
VVLLVMCRQIGISPLQLVRGEIDESDSAVVIMKAETDTRLERPPIQPTRIDPVVIRHVLEVALADRPLQPSMLPIADRLGQTCANLHHHFPQLCHAIASRHRSYQETQAAPFRTRLLERVRDAAVAFTHSGLYPSDSHIADLLGDRNVMRSRTARAAWHEVLIDHGWDRPNIELQAVMAQIA